MNKGRLEAFSDGVMAILITIMVLQLPTPAGGGLKALEPLIPVFLLTAPEDGRSATSALT